MRGLDWLSQEQLPLATAEDELASVAVDMTLDSSSSPAALFPSTGGNIHQFTAVTATAVLDVLAPPYSPGTGETHPQACVAYALHSAKQCISACADWLDYY